MLNQILFKNQSRLQLILAFLGAFLGFTFLITSFHYLIRVNEFGEEEEILGSNTLIVQKKVSNYNSIALGKTDFGKVEIKHLEGKDFVESVSPILNNSFDISIKTDSELIPYFSTDIFVQTVDHNFIKVDDASWQWKPGDEFVPVIMPREFLVMMNTFASAKGIPQVSDELAKSVKFKFTVSNENQKEKFAVKIIGFTNEMSSILVPTAFMEYGNENFPSTVPAKVTHLMTSIKEGRFGEFEKYMEANHLEPKESSVLIGKLKSIAGTLFSILFFISLLTIFLSILVLLQYAQLLMAKNKYEITTLLRIGYSPALITQKISRYFIKVFALITLSSIVVFGLAKFFIDKLFVKGGILIDNNFTWQSILAVLVVFGLYSLFNHTNAKKVIQKTQ
ncbi:hypothetical protein SAMN05216474_1062 [Lishizhenia tianjinensis]|uniref:FtsX-like permease family protein n=1 Tax=Lishizhenia tianjinensis TaxID=477690 RepID=A0A1I6YP63_9FLAO|nr:ABC transporter permease [Lishizhenia tianjinensis]SFT52247.1 hypothetical protein SAMN05216474_1062 [Lishizhenia tianjinensis]